MNGLENPFEKPIQSKKLKNSKNQSEIAASEQKATGEKANFSRRKTTRFFAPLPVSA